MNRLDYSKDLNTFSYSYNKKDIAIFELNDESQKEFFYQDYIMLYIIEF